ncbi:hypothetical protein [Brucella intermedia]|uniref:hypothetical protein n=1 Tax=Brucella intermedia TaxID=94625 RepID=UPI00235ECF7C|nr:hypothetical protein [Brucella intermedia]
MKLTRAFACLGYALSMGFILALTVTAPAHAAVPGPVMVSAPNADAPPDHFMKLDYFAVASVPHVRDARFIGGRSISFNSVKAGKEHFKISASRISTYVHSRASPIPWRN